jgi:MATE family multidrug resistance protein
MRTSSLNREILRLSLPNILSNMSIPLLGMVDTALMGRMESEIYIGAVALGSVIFNFIYWGFGFLRMGTTGLTAQAYGREERRETSDILGRALLVAAGGACLLILLQGVIAWAGFGLIQGGAEVKELARRYFVIRIYAAPATLGLYAFHGWFLGLQNARYPMFLTILINAANIVFNVFFVFRLDMKSDGVALGTVCAQYLGLAAAVILCVRKYRGYLVQISFGRLRNIQALKRFYSVNFDIFIRTMGLIFAFAFFVSQSAAVDSLTLAANQILLQYLNLMSYGVDGFAFAAESLVGRFTGQGKRATLRRSVRLLFMWGCGLGTVFSLTYLFFGRKFLLVFTDQQAIIQAADPYVWWMVLLPLAGSVAYMWDGVYIGATATRALRNMMILSLLGGYLPVYYLTKGILGNHGLWLALFFFMAARAATLGLMAPRQIFATGK